MLGRRSVKWWRYLFWFVVQLALVNSAILFQAANCPLPGNQRPFSQIQFRLDICKLLVKGKRKVNKRSASSAGLGSSLSSDHQLVRLFGRKAACTWCPKVGKKTNKGRTPETVWGCDICKVHLCKGLCFVAHHDALAALQKS